MTSYQPQREWKVSRFSNHLSFILFVYSCVTTTIVIAVSIQINVLPEGLVNAAVGRYVPWGLHKQISFNANTIKMMMWLKVSFS